MCKTFVLHLDKIGYVLWSQSLLTRKSKTDGEKIRPNSSEFQGRRKYKNLGVPVLFGGHNLAPLAEIRLTDLPKSGGAMAPTAPTGTTPLSLYVQLKTRLYGGASATLDFARHRSKTCSFKIISSTPSFWNLPPVLVHSTFTTYSVHNARYKIAVIRILIAKADEVVYFYQNVVEGPKNTVNQTGYSEVVRNEYFGVIIPV